MIEGLRPITSGDVILDGIKTAEQPYLVKQRIGIQLQSSAFFSKPQTHRVTENVSPTCMDQQSIPSNFLMMLG